MFASWQHRLSHFYAAEFCESDCNSLGCEGQLESPFDCDPSQNSLYDVFSDAVNNAPTHTPSIYTFRISLRWHFVNSSLPERHNKVASTIQLLAHTFSPSVLPTFNNGPSCLAVQFLLHYTKEAAVVTLALIWGSSEVTSTKDPLHSGYSLYGIGIDFWKQFSAVFPLRFFAALLEPVWTFFVANYVHPLKEGCNSSMPLLFARFSYLKLSCKDWTVMFDIIYTSNRTVGIKHTGHSLRLGPFV